MSATAPAAILEPFLAAADAAAAARPEVARDVARELMTEAAEMLHDGLALDHLDEHDLGLAVAALAADLAAPDPTEAVRARAAAPPSDSPRPEGVRGANLVVIQVLGL